jgi:hypothetical protein
MIAVLKVSAKVEDSCGIQAMDEDGQRVIDYCDYVPDFFPGMHFGDYLELDIDVKTGQILNWNRPTQAQIKRELKRR